MREQARKNISKSLSQREIKFRTIYQRGGDIVIKYYTLGCQKDEIIGGKEWKDAGFKIISRDLFTSLLDKNGKEIYEGDILKNEGEVVWIKESASFRINPSRENNDISFTESFLNIDNMEIIGNIYENPNLIQ